MACDVLDRRESWKRTDVVPRLSPRRWIRKVAQIGSGCWEWRGFRDKDGYGRTGIAVHGKREQMAHRVSYARFRGPIPDDQEVLHRCDNPPCIRPSHLFLGTQPDNVVDMIEKGRQRGGIGERNSGAKITENDVIDIRTLKSFGATTRILADEFGLAEITVQQINRRWIWAHLP